MKNYSVLYKTNTGEIHEHETNLIDLAYRMEQEIVEDGDFEWVEIADQNCSITYDAPAEEEK